MNNTNYTLLITQDASHFMVVKRALRKLHLPFKVVRLHTSDGKRNAFHMSSASYVFLRTLNLITAN